MLGKLPENKNPYSGRSPFDILGVPCTATSREIERARSEKLEEIDDAGYEDSVRIARRKEIDEAYNLVRDSKSRVAVEILFYDKSVGQEECRTAAEKNKTLRFEYGRILQGAEEIFPSSPDIHNAKEQFAKVAFQDSVHLKTEGHLFTIDPRAEALASITFER